MEAPSSSSRKGGVRHRNTMHSPEHSLLTIQTCGSNNSSSTTSTTTSPRRYSPRMQISPHRRITPRSSPRDGSSFFTSKRWRWRRAQKWSMAFLVCLIIMLSTTCSLFVSTFSFWWWAVPRAPYHDLPWRMTSTVSSGFLRRLPQGSSSSYSRRVVHILEDVDWAMPRAVPTVVAPGTLLIADSADAITFSKTTDGTMMHSLIDADLDDEEHKNDWQPVDWSTSKCQPLADWQIKSFPNCNNLHEISLHSLTVNAEKEQQQPEPEVLSVLGQGWFRTTFRFDRSIFGSTSKEENDASKKKKRHDDDKQKPLVESVVLKTLRMEREYKPEYYELHRRDAVAMERLTFSPFVVNVHAACGNSAINELADFPYKGVQSLEVFNRRLRGHENNAVYKIKLRMAASIAVGVADIHGLDYQDRSTMVHYDLNPRNVALFKGGRPKLNDFNVAEFLTYDPETNQTCGFPARLHEPWWRAPEEVFKNETRWIDEKVDIYALGNILFHTLTTHSPRGKMKEHRMAQVRELVQAGIRPVLPPPYDKSYHPAAVAIRQAMDLCFAAKASDRGTAQEVADILMDALVKTKDVAPAEEETQQQDWSKPNNEDDDEEESGEEGTGEAKG